VRGGAVVAVFADGEMAADPEPGLSSGGGTVAALGFAEAFEQVPDLRLLAYLGPAVLGLADQDGVPEAQRLGGPFGRDLYQSLVAGSSVRSGEVGQRAACLAGQTGRDGFVDLSQLADQVGAPHHGSAAPVSLDPRAR
jgi:hypothetical protein